MLREIRSEGPLWFLLWLGFRDEDFIFQMEEVCENKHRSLSDW